jgi:hypothetical protein
MITNEELDAMQAVIDAATPGPWTWDRYPLLYPNEPIDLLAPQSGHGRNRVLLNAVAPLLSNRVAITQARTDWPRCIAELREAKKKIEEYLETIRVCDDVIDAKKSENAEIKALMAALEIEHGANKRLVEMIALALTGVEHPNDLLTAVDEKMARLAELEAKIAANLPAAGAGH